MHQLHAQNSRSLSPGISRYHIWEKVSAEHLQFTKYTRDQTPQPLHTPVLGKSRRRITEHFAAE